MRRRLLVSALGIALVVIALLGVPFAITGPRLLESSARHDLEAEAQSLLSLVSGVRHTEEPDEHDDGDEVIPAPAVAADELDRTLRRDRLVTIALTSGGAVRAGVAPPGEVLVATVADARGNTARLVASADTLHARILTLWLGIAAASAAALAIAAALAQWQSRRLARPLEQLAVAGARLGADDLLLRVPPSGIPEVDAVGSALEGSAQRVADALDRERAFSANVAHQLRTPMTALELQLEEIAATSRDEASRAQGDAAIEQLRRLQQTVEDMLTLARQGRAGAYEDIDLSALISARAASWEAAFTEGGRRLDVRAAPGLRARSVRGAIEQALDVLVDNALRHGADPTGVEARVERGAIKVCVSDAGTGFTAVAAALLDGREPASATGRIGLLLARTLVEESGGRIVLVSRGAPTIVEIVLPLRAESPAR